VGGVDEGFDGPPAVERGVAERSTELLQLASAHVERAGQRLDVDRCRRQLRALTA
jgi:hypothetical protein